MFSLLISESSVFSLFLLFRIHFLIVWSSYLLIINFFKQIISLNIYPIRVATLYLPFVNFIFFVFVMFLILSFAIFTYLICNYIFHFYCFMFSVFGVIFRKNFPKIIEIFTCNCLHYFHGFIFYTYIFKEVKFL